MKRTEIIEKLKEAGIEFNPTLRLPDLTILYEKHFGTALTPPTMGSTSGPETTQTTASIGKEPTVIQSQNPKTDTDKILEMMGQVISKVDSLDKRLNKVEGPTGNEFKVNAKKEDVSAASKLNVDVDGRIVDIVQEVLGTDFGIELETFPDKPGYLFTVIVPTRLSDLQQATRPVIDSETGKYKVSADGKTPVLEDYIPQDRRSRAIGGTQSYEAIRKHCVNVRSYIVSYYTKVAKPLPEFRIKN